MTTLSTSAWILHDLGMAAGFGGTLFGKAALDPAVRSIESAEERGRVLDDAWGRFRAVDAAALGAMAATWLVGRTAFSGRFLGAPTRRLVIAKDLLITGALVTGVGTLIAGRILHRQRERGGLRVASGTTPAGDTPPRARSAQRFLTWAGPINAACVAGTIAVNAALAQASGKSARWTFLSRLLP